MIDDSGNWKLDLPNDVNFLLYTRYKGVFNALDDAILLMFSLFALCHCLIYNLLQFVFNIRIKLKWKLPSNNQNNYMTF